MKITVEIEEKDLDDICRMTGEPKKGPAIRKLVTTALMLQRRREISDKFMSGEWSVDLPTYDEMKASAKSKDPWNS